MSDWADDSGDLPPLSAGLPPPPPTTTTTVPKPSTSVPAPQVASPAKSGYVPPHLRNRQAAAGDERGSRGFGASSDARDATRRDATRDGKGGERILVVRTRARDDADDASRERGGRAIAEIDRRSAMAGDGR